jgi:hypothetical protein
MFSSNSSQVSQNAVFIEDVMSTTLYTGTGAAQTITNGIDLAGKGGLVWLKARSQASTPNMTDTVRGAGKLIYPNLTNAEATGTWGVNSFNSNGFGITGADGANNGSGTTYASWTFREQPKFFDVVTFSTTTSSSVPITVNHNLGSVPGCIIVKQTNGAADWFVYHRSLGSSQYLALNSTDQSQNGGTSKWASTPTSTSFTLGGDFVQNATYVAYLFAHNAGGFGLTGTDNVISCGSFTSNSDGSASVNLGYEPQFLLYKRTDSTGDWILLDTMRGFSQTSGAMLRPNTSGAEQVVSGDLWNPTATGFIGEPGTFGVSTQNIYIAIRRGPMKVPTTGTSVFSPNATSAATGTTLTTGFPVDLSIAQARTSGDPARWEDRLRGANSPNYSGATPTLRSDSTAAETTATITLGWNNTSIQMPSYYGGVSSIFWNFRRAPGFFDEVCYTGTGATQNIPHNLTVKPELWIVKRRNASAFWPVWVNGFETYEYMDLSSSGFKISDGPSNQSFISNSTQLTIQTAYSSVNASGGTYVAYLFASAPGVSKVGSFTGTGTTQVINCGFTGGARFVLIKATSTTGDWYVWDSARGIVSGNDPYLALNSTAAEVTNTDWVDTAATGFELSNAGGNLANSNGVSYIYFSVA